MLDTDMLSEIGKGIDPIVVRNAVAYRKKHGFLTISVISIMEVIQGYQRVGSSARIEVFQNSLLAEEVISFDPLAAALAGQIAGKLDRAGLPIGRCDPMIAAIALSRGFELVTGNTSHYQRLSLIGHPLVLMNWRF
ncbi:PIN domain-containing protein [Tundrisphaera lichenicola]|uniref:PIN domain-containing protein n=1 Tax=Tundrisphaera lichenicola TaxID=2029860 RepID=UPI003EB6F3F9